MEAYLRLIVMFFLAAILADPSSQDPAPAKESSGSISGRVTVNGKPAPAVAVIAVPADSDSSAMAQRMLGRSVMFKSSSDPDGLYRITGVPAGRYRVTVFSPSHVQERDEDTGDSGKSINLSDGEAVEGIDFDLEPGAVITGTVTDQSGRPLIREFISLILIGESGKKTPWSIDSQDESMFYTDDRGVYRIYGLAEGRYLVTAGGSGGRASGMFASRRNTRRTFHPNAIEESKAKVLDVKEGAELSGIDIKMAPAGKGYAVFGRIVESQTGTPIPNTMIFYSRMSGDADIGTGQPGTSSSNAQGEFRFEGLQQGTYMAGVFFTGQSEFYGENITFEVKNADLTGVEIKVHRGGSIQGTVSVEGTTDAEAIESLARLFVQAVVTNPDKPGFSYGRGKINADGSFRVTGIASGKVQIKIEDYLSQMPLRIVRVERDGVEQQGWITMGPGENISGVRIVLSQATGSIRGRVVLEGGPLPSDTQLIVSSHLSGKETVHVEGNTTQIEPGGLFVINKLLPGDYELSFSAWQKHGADQSSDNPLLKHSVTVKAGETTEVTVTINLKQKDRD
jgi:hypothetical protein